MTGDLCRWLGRAVATVLLGGAAMLMPVGSTAAAQSNNMSTMYISIDGWGSGTVTSLRAVKGVVQTTTKVVEKKTYTAVNRGSEARTLIIEHPRRDAFTLTSKDKPWTRKRHRLH